ncbi:adenylyltransferase/cytidyltransferase family protein [Deinococcus sp. MIMF12]|uniref:Adenylyltransferase/cytidyltransferase family protein n=1 Tax=Deinococcus rhizophilus TaxID=3049544 RepID=A0ABT7JFB6_9DEIO|nr:adenylyltransferase/cytidyltransferase family protein [Deinococcus rhizophilus]MDL2343754.1 adenylyltransferase/cytidyltransferase family protein [Deinococcus rhizophilus]
MTAGAVYVGRFQPPHAAHLGTVREALAHADHLLVLLGSANLARSVKNPFSAPERAGMLRRALREAGADLRRVTFRPLPDRFDADLWAADVRREAAGVFGEGAPVSLVGFEKDASTAYLRWFPGWGRLPVPEVPGLNATDLRAAYFTGRPLPDGVPEGVRTFLARFTGTPAYPRLRAEWAAVEAARAALPPAARLHEERWLQVEGERAWLHTRRDPIGSGLWELPGRVLPPGETAAGGVEFAHPARALVAPTTAHVYREAVPAALPARPVPLALALRTPRRFHEDHHVIFMRLLDGAARSSSPG